MTQQHRDPATTALEEAALCQSARRLLDQSVEALEPEVEQALRMRREQALARRSGPQTVAQRLARPLHGRPIQTRLTATVFAQCRRWLLPEGIVAWPGPAFASLAVVLMGVNVWLATPPADLPPQALAEEELEILEDLEFYAWLEWQHWQAPVSAPAS